MSLRQNIYLIRKKEWVSLPWEIKIKTEEIKIRKYVFKKSMAKEDKDKHELSSHNRRMNEYNYI